MSPSQSPTPRPPSPEYFDYIRVAAAARISASDLAAIEARVRVDYPADQMMFELRMMRICNAIKNGVASIADALRADSDQQGSGQAAA